MIVGIPKEVKTDEYRVAITPAGVRELTSAGHRVYIEHGAGEGSSMPDEDFIRTGAEIIEDVDDLWAAADLVCKVKEPVPEEYHRLGARSGQTLFTYLHLAASRECTDALIAGGNVGIAYETVRQADNSLPLLAPMSEVAGRMRPGWSSSGQAWSAWLPPPWPWACTQRCSSWTGTWTDCVSSTITSGVRWKPSLPRSTPLRRSASRLTL
jgi:alanine dehydrogenase